MGIWNDNIFTVSCAEAKDIHDAITSWEEIQLSEVTRMLVWDQVQILEWHLSQLPKKSSFDEVFTWFRWWNEHYMIDTLNITL